MEAKCIKAILLQYEVCLGQKVKVFFSKNMMTEDKDTVCNILEGIVPQRSSKDLGLPMVIGRSKKQVFEFVKNRVKRKVQNWKNQLLSPGGKEVLLKSVALALPVYSMSCFKLPKGLCADITSIMSSFWWGQKDEEQKIHWVAWRKMTESKEEGGLGFKDLQSFNDALLAKQLWRLITKPNSLMSRVLKQKYFPKANLFQAKIPTNASWLWRSWTTARYLLQEGCL